MKDKHRAIVITSMAIEKQNSILYEGRFEKTQYILNSNFSLYFNRQKKYKIQFKNIIMCREFDAKMHLDTQNIKQFRYRASVLSLVYTSTPNGSRTTREWFANQMCVCVDGTVNLRCTICKRFAYHLPQIEICQFFARTQRELDVPDVLSMHQMSFLASGLRKIN